LQARTEEAMPSDAMQPADVISWFQGRDPVSGEGMIKLGDAYLRKGDESNARNWIRRGWIEGNFSLDRISLISSKYGRLLSADDHKRRASRLVWANEFGQANAMSIWGMTVMIAPISGPFLGGYLTESLSWRWVFYVNLPIGIPALALLWWLLPSRPIVRRRLDIFGAVMLGLALCGLQLMLDRGQHNDWLEARETVVELLFALSCFWVFFIHTRTVDHPLFERAMVRDPNFLVALGFMVVLGITNVALSSVLPTMYQNVYGYDVIDTGMLMAPRGVGVLLTMFVANRMMGKVDTRLLITTGYLLAAASMWMMTRWSLDMGAQQIVLSAFLQGLGLGFVFVPINLLAFSTLLPRHRTDGTTLMTLFRNLGASFGISAIVTVLSRNMQTSHADIAASVTSYNQPVDPGSLAAQLGSVGDTAMSVLNGEVTRQAAMIAYLDNFYMLFWLLLAIAPLALLLRKPKPMVRQEPVHAD
jgi:DHA2 family multidrug resistance protein